MCVCGCVVCGCVCVCVWGGDERRVGESGSNIIIILTACNRDVPTLVDSGLY